MVPGNKSIQCIFEFLTIPQCGNGDLLSFIERISLPPDNEVA